MPNKSVNRAVFLILSMLYLPIASAEERIRVEDPQRLFAIAFRQGEANGEIVGPIANSLRKQLSTDEPLLLDVKKVRDLKTPGCARFKVHAFQANVLNPRTQKRADQEMTYEVSYCNGRGVAPNGTL